MGKTKLAVLVTLVAAAVLAATAAVASTNKSPSISLRTTKVGKVLVAANGRTLYLFTADKSTKSSCYEQCAVYWPPLIAAKPTARIKPVVTPRIGMIASTPINRPSASPEVRPAALSARP